MSDPSALYELKETAKWSHKSEERLSAVRQLAMKGPNAIPQLEEIRNITAYEDIKSACAEAIRAIANTGDGRITEPTTSDNNDASRSLKLPAKSQKKEEKEGESQGEAYMKLADLPP